MHRLDFLGKNKAAKLLGISLLIFKRLRKEHKIIRSSMPAFRRLYNIKGLELLKLHVEDLEKNYLRINAAAAFIGISTTTLRTRDKEANNRLYKHPYYNWRMFKKTDLEKIKKNYQEARYGSDQSNLPSIFRTDLPQY